MANNKGRRSIGAIIVLIGAILLIAAVFIPWYTFEEKSSSSFGSGSTTINSYPGLPNQGGTVQCSSSGAGSCPSPASNSYQGLNENNTGVVAETGFFMLIAGFVLGLIGAILGVMSRGNPRRAMPALALGVIALILAIATPLMFMVALPGALSKDVSASTRAQSGPWSTFFGSNSSTPFEGVTVSTTWGPGIGWYLSFGAFVVLLIGIILLFRYRTDPPEPAPVSAPMATPAPASPP